MANLLPSFYAIHAEAKRPNWTIKRVQAHSCAPPRSREVGALLPDIALHGRRQGGGVSVSAAIRPTHSGSGGHGPWSAESLRVAWLGWRSGDRKGPASTRRRGRCPPP